MQRNLIPARLERTKYLRLKNSRLVSQQAKCVISMNSEDDMIKIFNRTIHEYNRYRVIVFASHTADFGLQMNVMVLWESA